MNKFCYLKLRGEILGAIILFSTSALLTSCRSSSEVITTTDQPGSYSIMGVPEQSSKSFDYAKAFKERLVTMNMKLEKDIGNFVHASHFDNECGCDISVILLFNNIMVQGTYVKINANDTSNWKMTRKTNEPCELACYNRMKSFFDGFRTKAIFYYSDRKSISGPIKP